MRQLYLAATGMNRGKTTFALGLVADHIDIELLLRSFGTWRPGALDGEPDTPDGVAADALERVRGSARQLAGRATEAIDRLRGGRG